MVVRPLSRDATLLVASTGGHLEELRRLLPRIRPPVDTTEWVTFDDPQSRSLLAGSVVHYVPYVKPRGLAAVARIAPTALEMLGHHRFHRVISTGSGVAIPFIAAGCVLGVPCHYIESAARSEGPSLTGRVVSHVPGTYLYTQYSSWSSPQWAYRGSLFDIYAAGSSVREVSSASTVVVTLGTMRTYPFRRAVVAVCSALPEVARPDAEVLWQVGGTDISDLPVCPRNFIPASEWQSAIQDADLVIAHAGIGSALAALDAGHCPVLLPRRKAHNEHVDDHQQLIASELAQRGLAVTCDPSELTPHHLLRAMQRPILSRTPAPLMLNQSSADRLEPSLS